MKRTPLARRVPLKQGTGRKPGGMAGLRVPLKWGTEPKPGKRRTPKDTGPSPKVREVVFGRDLGRCVRCGKGLIRGRGDYSIHHRFKRSHGVDNSPQNLVTLCGDGVAGCHGHVHAYPREALDNGWLLKEGDDPAKVTVAVAVAPGEFVTHWLLPDGERTTDRPEQAGAA